MQLLWTAQHDRHGVADPERSLQVGDLEAEGAIHLATTLTHWFSAEVVTRVQ